LPVLPDRFRADHAYGLACYRPGGCADIIETVAHRIDASQFNRQFRGRFRGSFSMRSGDPTPAAPPPPRLSSCSIAASSPACNKLRRPKGRSRMQRRDELFVRPAADAGVAIGCRSAALGATERADLFAGTAARFYRISGVG
jgi:hypothetical protein